MSKVIATFSKAFKPMAPPSRYKAAWGGRGCIHKDTLIDTPSGQVKVKDFKGGEVYSYHDGEKVIAYATPAQEYTVEDLYEVTLGNGSSIIATDEHKFLTAKGWKKLADLSMCDEVVIEISKGESLVAPSFYWSIIKEITYHSRQAYWDLHVFGTNNYLSNGIVNHNSGKSHFFAELMILKCLSVPGTRCVCIREVQKTLKESAKKLLEDKIEKLGVQDHFTVQTDRIVTPGDGVIIFQGMQDHTAESIKSLEGFDIAWVEEAQTLSETSLRLLRPTIRAEGSEIWFSWNPRLKTDPVDILFRQQTPPTNSIVVKANWSDNPWFPKELEQERLDGLNNEPDQYEHIWEGGYVTVSSGAYFAKHLAEARRDNRIGTVPIDPLMTVRLFVDIGGTGSRSDNFVIVCAQFVGLSVRVINHYESQGQDLATHLAWLRAEGYTPDRAQIWLPHDGKTNDKVQTVSYESEFTKAGYNVTVIPNQGKGAAKMRVESVRSLFPSIWIDEDRCSGLIDALGWYHEKIDTHRNIGLGPDHDWSSHSADAFGLMAITYEPPKRKKPLQQPKLNIA